MEIRQSTEEDVVILELDGSLDAATHGDFEKKIVDLIDSGETDILLDLKGLNYVSSVGLRVFLTAQKKMMAASGSIVLCSLDETVVEVFEISGFSSFFTICDDRDEALEEF